MSSCIHTFVSICVQMHVDVHIIFFSFFRFYLQELFHSHFFPNNNEKEKYYRKNVSEIQFARTVEIAMKLALIIIAYLTESTQREDTSTPFIFFSFILLNIIINLFVFFCTGDYIFSNPGPTFPVRVLYM